MRLFADEARKREIMRRILRRQLGEEPSEERIDIELEQRRQALTPEETEQREEREWREFGRGTERERAEQPGEAPQEQEEAPAAQVPSLMKQLGVIKEQATEAAESLTNLAQLYDTRSNELEQALEGQEELAIYVPEVREKFAEITAKINEATNTITKLIEVSDTIGQQTKQFISPGGGPGLGQQIKDWYKRRVMNLPHRVKKRQRGEQRHRRRESLKDSIMRQVTGGPIRVTPKQVEYGKLKRQTAALFQELDEAAQQVSDQIEELMKTYFSDKSTLLPAAKAQYNKMRKGLFSDEDKQMLAKRKAVFQRMWGDGATSGAYMQIGYSSLLNALADLQAGTAQLPVVLAYLPTEIGGNAQMKTTDEGAREVQDYTAEELETEFEGNEGAGPQPGELAQGQSEVNKLQRRLAEQNRQRRRRRMRQLMVSD